MHKKIGALLLGFFLSHTAFSMDAVDQLKNFSKMTKTSSGEFLQQQISQGSDGKLKVNKELSGTFTFSRPGKFLWQVVKPYEQKILSDGKQLVMWDKDLNQATFRPAGQVLGDIALEQYFDLKLIGEKNGLTWVEMIPKASKNGSSEIPYSTIGIGMANNLPQAMELRDTFGNVVLLSFKQIKTNIAVSPSEFSFKNPPGVDIVKLP